MNAPLNSATIDRRAATGGFPVYVIIVGLTLLAALNPISIRVAIRFGVVGNAYLLTLDLCLVVAVVLAALYLRSGRRLYKALAVASVVSIVPIMLVAELAYTYLYLRFHNAVTGVKVTNVYEPDPKFGWRLIPNAVGHHVFPGNFDVTYVMDAAGHRRLPQALVTSPTVHVFGTSFTFSDGVRDDQTALYLLASAHREKFRVIDYSVSAYGLDQMVLALETNQDAIAPGDVVMVAPTSISLSWNWIERGRPCSFKLVEGSYPIGSIPFLTPAGWTFVDIHKTCPTFETVVLNSSLLVGSIVAALRAEYVQKTAVAHADLLFARARKIVEARGARFLPVMLVNADECRTGRYLFDLSGLKTPIVSMMPYCPKDPSKLDGMNFPKDWHYTVKGNQWMAEVLNAMLSKSEPGLE
jgi:hypothetical protein